MEKEKAIEMAKLAIHALEDKKAEDIRIIDISQVSVIADYFIIANGGSQPQINALMENVQEKMNQAGYQVKRIEGNRNSSWVLLDYGDVVVHVFNREDRLFYDLERIWSDGKVVSPEALNS